jgi:hypothetical protein
MKCPTCDFVFDAANGLECPRCGDTFDCSSLSCGECGACPSLSASVERAVETIGRATRERVSSSSD